MTLLDRLERRYGRYSVPNLTLYLIAGQVATYLLGLARPELLEMLSLVPARVLAGEPWRVMTFLLTPPLPPQTHPIWAFFFWYFFYFMGTALEGHWGAFRYNVYLLVGWVATLAASCFTPEMPASPGFLQGSVFLAFAFLYPEFVIYLFLLIPVKVKWLAWLAWLGYLMAMLNGTWTTRALVAASVANFFLFFGSQVLARIRQGHRAMVRQSGRVARSNEPFHRCTVCGITDRTHPDMDFRYCTKCGGRRCYCTEHIRTHEHVVPAAVQEEGRRGVGEEGGKDEG